MDKLSVIGKIGTILSDLQKQQDFFTSHPESLNEVEVELFAASASYLAEYAKVLKKFPVNRMGTPPVPPKAAAQAIARENDDDDIGFRLSFEEDDKKIHQPGEGDAIKPRVAGEPASQPAPQLHQDTPDSDTSTGITDMPEPSTPPGTTPAAEAPDGNAPAPVLPVKPAVPESADPVPKDATPDPAQPQENEPEIPAAAEDETPRRVSLNDRFGEKKSTLYERIVPAQEQQPSQAPVANLGRSIGINERYYFIKTLFQDDKVAFDQAITRIDMCHSLGEALEYTNKSLAGKFNWNRKEEDARKFYDLLKRRFL